MTYIKGNHQYSNSNNLKKKRKYSIDLSHSNNQEIQRVILRLPGNRDRRKSIDTFKKRRAGSLDK